LNDWVDIICVLPVVIILSWIITTDIVDEFFFDL